MDWQAKALQEWIEAQWRRRAWFEQESLRVELEKLRRAHEEERRIWAGAGTPHADALLDSMGIKHS